MPNDKAKELTTRELIALERGDELEPVATCKDYLQVQDALQARITELEKDYAALLKSNSDRFSVQIQNACENSLVLKKCIDECNILRKDKAELETQLADLRANSRTKIELDTCRSLNDSLRDENVRLIAENKKLKGGE